MHARAELPHLMRRMGQESHGLAEAFATRHGLHPTDLRALLAVIEAEQAGTALQPVELVRALGRSSGSVSAVLDRLERDGHLRREPDSTDRRRVTLHRGPRAEAMTGEFFGELARRTDEVLDGFSAAEQAVVARFLQQTVQVMAQFRADMSR